WKWYVDTLVGAQFVVHSSIMPGDIHVEDQKSPITKGLPGLWHRSEEWYSFAENPRGKPGIHILATVDEKSYTPRRATMAAAQEPRQLDATTHDIAQQRRRRDVVPFRKVQDRARRHPRHHLIDSRLGDGTPARHEMGAESSKTVPGLQVRERLRERPSDDHL